MKKLQDMLNNPIHTPMQDKSLLSAPDALRMMDPLIKYVNELDIKSLEIQ